MAQIGDGQPVDKIEEDLVRHMVLNSIRSYKVKFEEEYGELIIACDSPNCWRKEIFPYYKANRKQIRDASGFDWNSLFQSLNKIRDELKENFPYRVIGVIGAEADDVIATLVNNTHEKILILSGDKDFIQLQRNMNVKQYDPVRKKFITHNDPEKFIREHIIRGDSGDGVPNFLSPDNSFVMKIRQKPIMEKKLVDWVKLDPEQFCDETMMRNYKRNQQLIDLSFIPEKIKNDVISEFENQSNKSRKHLFNYFVEKKLKNLLENINEF